MKLIQLIGLVGLLFFTACQSEKVEEDAAFETITSLPYYDSFEEFKPVLNKQDDNIYVVNFWATWCKPCVAELPYFEELRKKYKGKNVKVILVSLDFEKHVEKKVIPFVNKHKLLSEVMVFDDPDQNSWIDQVSTKWSGAIPATVIYKGDKRAFFEQSFTFEELEKEVKEFL